MIGDRFDRITFLMQHNRHQEAVVELNQVLLDQPNNPILMMLLAENHSELNNLKEAATYAGQAVQLAPDLDDSHRTLARVYSKQRKTKLALAHAQEAVELSPAEADNYATLGAIYLDRMEWKAAIGAANRGLALEPEHLICLNIRTMALTKIGKQAEIEDTIQAALKEDPENALTHANWGWSKLHRGKSDQAIMHFKEALRLDPAMEWARAGMVEAIKSKNIIYALILKFYLWLAKFPPRIQLILIIGLFAAEKLIRGAMSFHPGLAPLANGILIAYVAFVFMVWMSSAFFNLLLRLHPEGKLALSAKQVTASNWFALGLVTTFSMAAALYPRLQAPSSNWLMLVPLFALFPITVWIKSKPGRTKWIMGAYTLISLGLILAALGVNSIALLQFSLLLSVLSTWIGNFIPKDEALL